MIDETELRICLKTMKAHMDRLYARQICPVCGGYHLIVAGYTEIDLHKGTREDNSRTDQCIPTIMIGCERCGYLQNFSIGIIEHAIQKAEAEKAEEPTALEELEAWFQKAKANGLSDIKFSPGNLEDATPESFAQEVMAHIRAIEAGDFSPIPPEHSDSQRG